MTPWNSIAKTYVKVYQRLRLAWDLFGHDETATWGNLETTSSAQAWTSTGGSASDYSITDGVAEHLLPDTANRISALTSLTATDVTLKSTLRVDQLAAGASIAGGVALRYTDTSNYYFVEVVMGTSQAITFRIRKRVAGTTTTLSSITHTLTHSVSTWYGLTLEVVGPIVRARLWDSTEDEPDEWDVESDGQFDLLFGGIATRSAISGGNTNVNPTVEYGEVTAFSPAQWNDVTSYTKVADGPVEGFVGRQTELAAIEASNLSFRMKNQTGWFTPDNILSPYWPDWKTGLPIRFSETIGARSFAFPDMFLEIPEVTVSFEAAGDPTHTDRTLAVNCVDLLTRLNRAPRFPSNLAAYIIGEAPEGELMAYWPLTDAAGSTYASSYGPITQDPLRFEQVDAAGPSRFVDSLLSFGQGEGVPGDDATAVQFLVPGFGGGVTYARLGTYTATGISPGSTQTVVLVAWVNSTSTLLGGNFALLRDTTTSAFITMSGDGSGNWELGVCTTGSGSAFLSGSAIAVDQWTALAVQINFASGAYEFWVNRGRYTGSLASGGGLDLTRLVLDGPATDSLLAHVQVYMGGTYTNTDFLAQYDRGINGWPQQRVDERIRQIANYAGIADGQLALEESDSLIQAPAWAGQRPGDLATAAATTGGGILFTRDTHLVYHDRKHRFGL